jgi:hypothetical protein
MPAWGWRAHTILSSASHNRADPASWQVVHNVGTGAAEVDYGFLPIDVCRLSARLTQIKDQFGQALTLI